MTITPILRLFLCAGLLSLACSAAALEVRVGLYENEPKIYSANGTASGILIDLLEAVAAQEGWHLQYVPCAWEQCLRQLESGQIDLMPDVAYSEERARRYDFHSTPALYSWSQVYRRNDTRIATLHDLQGKRIALLGGGIQQEGITALLGGFDIQAQLVRTTSVKEAFRLAQAGEADAAIAGHYFGDLHKTEFQLADTPVIFQSSRLFYATAHGQHPELLQAIEHHLSAWHADPGSTYYAIIKRWGGHAPTPAIPTLLWQVMLALLGLVILAILGMLVLRRQIRLKTRQLSRSNAELQRYTQLYAALSQCNQAIVRSPDEATLFPQICRDAVEFGGMKLAWIGKLDPTSHRVRPVAWYGVGTDYLRGINISTDAEDPTGRGPTGTALRENRPYWCQDFAHNPATAPWHERAHDFGWQASASLPLSCHGNIAGVLTLYAGECDAFDEAARKLLLEMAMDVSFALERFADEAKRATLEEEKQASQERYQRLFQAMATGFALHEIICDADGHPVDYRFLEVNPAFELLTGLKAADIIGRPVREIIPDLEPFWVERYGKVALTGETLRFEHCAQTLGKHFEVVAYCPQPGRFATLFTDSTERHRMENSLRESEEKYRALTESINDVIWTLDTETLRFLYVSPSVYRLRGYTPEEIMAQPMDAALTPEGAKHVRGLINQSVAAFQAGHIGPNDSSVEEIEQPCKDGSTVWTEVVTSFYRNEKTGRIEVRGVTRNITERKQAEAQIKQLAHSDLLTGLPNRSQLNERFKFALSMAQRSGEQLAVMFLDLDHFKDINDTLGHSVGDRLLMEMAKRLKATLREEDTVSRQGGDEFVLILPDTDEHGAAKVAAKLMEVVAQPCQIDQHELSSTLSIGIAIYPHDGEDLETLSRNADTAMYRAKQEGRNDFRFFTAEMQAHSARALQLGSALRQALARNQLQLYYQPQVSIDDGHVVGAEALLRWRHPELGPISPAEFIPIAEDSGQIIQIGEWVLRTAIRQLKDWLDSGLPPMMIAVNLSAAQFRQPNLTEQVTRILDEVGLPHEHLELELTEAVAMDDPQGAIEVMDKLHAQGIRMSIDDFGTGYSSLSYLKRFKVYKLKIDQSFVHDITDDPEDKAIVTAIINMASSLGMQTIAEGVETAGQLSFLRLQGCNEVQGYYFSKPLTAEQFQSYLQEQKS